MEAVDSKTFDSTSQWKYQVFAACNQAILEKINDLMPSSAPFSSWIPGRLRLP
jgi:hypothetical protein